MKTTVKYGIDAPIWNGGNWLIGIADFRIKKNNLNIFCNYTRKRDGSRLWKDTLWINEKFCMKYPTKQIKKKYSFKLYYIPLADIQDFNNQLWDKYYAKQNANLTSPIYSKKQISEILEKSPQIREIAEMFGGGEITPHS